MILASSQLILELALAWHLDCPLVYWYMLKGADYLFLPFFEGILCGIR